MKARHETAFTRRQLVGAALAGFGFLAAAPLRAGLTRPSMFEISMSEAEWRRRLSPAAFAVLRQRRTERPGTSKLLKEKRRGIYVCGGCALPLFSSTTRFESGTGWPSFYASLADAVRTEADFELGYRRTEVRCGRCGGHLGHVFGDGPRPTGKRYCINGVALDFQPA